MKKFTLSYLVDSDSNKSANSLANISNSNIEMDLPKITELNIIIKDLNKQNFIKTFFRYVSRGECQKVEKLLSKGFDPNIHCPKTGETPLTIAVTRSKPYEMISTLISGGAHRDFYSLAGYTPLHKAVTVGNFEGVKTLLDFGQSPNCLDKYGLTPLYYNILYDPDTKICHSLLYEHSKIGISDKDGLQEIHQATRLNRVEQINLLLMYGADVNARCKRPKETVKNNLTLSIRPQSVDGDTPLHVAANHNQRAAVLRLLSWGADPTLVNAESMTPIQVAQNNGNLELADLIKLFRGRKESSDIFLPTPTYNPHRRVRQPPPNSYITEPSILQNYTPNDINEIHLNDQQLNSTNNNTNDLLRDSNKDSTNFNITEKSATCTCSYTTTTSTRPIDSKTIPTPCYDVNAASNQIYCEMPRYENGTNLAGTLTRPVKLKQKCKDMSISKSRTDVFTSNLHCQQQQPQRHQCPKMLGTEYKNPSKERTISRGQQTDVLYDFITREDKGFQREGSQTDSGISNSSCRPITFGSLSRTHNNKIHHDQSDKYQDGALSSYDSFGQGNKKDSTNFESTQFSKDLPSNDNKSYMNKLNQQTNNVKSVHVNICDSRHLRRSSTLHEHLDCKRSTNSKDNIRTVILERYAYSSNGIDKNERSSFGLSIRTVKNSSVIAEFTPTTNKPSLQTVKRVVPDSPAEKAGVKVGDFVLKINGADVTKASLNQVVDLLSSSSGDKVSLTLLSPKCITPSVLNNNSGSIHHVNGENDGDGCVEHYVITRKSIRSTKLARHSTISPISSERSSDRTYISSLNENSCLTDEGVYCQSLCTSSNVSGRSSSSSRLITNSNPVQQSSMPNNKQTFDASTHRVRFQGLPRSQTTNGISDICNDKSGNSMINSLYFPRHPRFQRVGSNESQNSSYSQTNYIQTPRQQNIDLHIVDERLHKHFSSDYPASVTRGISSKQSPLLRSYFTPEQQNLSIITGKPSHLIRRPISLNPETRKKSATYLSDNESPSTVLNILKLTEKNQYKTFERWTEILAYSIKMYYDNV
ncbi:putative sh3 and multiple ankyrin repeat domains protein 1,2 (shank1,2) [Schistosoma mansoni]|uniref:putative sh3 and multiple ankyrin repeat domains protein 1,2 (shank1,2) n=1 Tax=Schistosoma mansoni TaxID=6183 RepID=UPI00022DCC58|nr:putative sh3 and multiple ankyrin repeat domains protein 1,2 (shank1,2) [Schistosoma mansoni]|eukprot:XP_018654772.1 putative sh3 and multiple ankyrin repeat domains protein 1,2 (shank1,2) [Schistosoma mansoni]